MLESLVPGRTQGNLLSPPSSSRNDLENDANPWPLDPRRDTSTLPEMVLSAKGVDFRMYDVSVDGTGSITFANEASPGSFGETVILNFDVELGTS
jgi:hypothetical protein